MGFVFHFMHSIYESDTRVPADDVPIVVRDALSARFPGLDEVEWKFDEHYEAGFTWKDAEDTEAYFESDGTWVRSEFPIDAAGLPEAAKAYLKTQPGYRVVDVERIESATNTVTFQVELKNLFSEWDVVFDESGEVLTRTRDGPVIEPGVETDPDDGA